MTKKQSTAIDMDIYQQYIHKSRYARWDYDKNRRENWDETVQRYLDFMVNHTEKNLNYTIDQELQNKIFDYIYNLKTMPSMRALMTAGKALEREGLAQYNCSFAVVDNIRIFDEALYILMNGVGFGYSVERQYITKLPEVPEDLYETDSTIIVTDSKLGWAKALKELIAMLYAGQIPKWDVSKVRAAGKPLKVFGGRSSGSDVLVDIFNNTINILKKAKGRKLNSAECSDIICHIASAVVCGGVRRSALICLSNLSDERMRNYKTGQWWIDNPQRAMANISVAYTEKPEIGIFMKEWQSLYESKSGERGIFNRVAAKKQFETNTNEREFDGYEFGCNPCIVGDTLVALADGRGHISIKELVENNEDNIPVYCIGNNNEIVIRNMVHPRITGYNVPIYKVTLDNGRFVRVTENHKFRLRKTHEYKEVKDLKPGDSLTVLHKYTPNFKTYSRGNQYISLTCTGSIHYEHKMIAEHFNDLKIDSKTHINHIDGNKLNNSPTNLKLMSEFDHLSQHSINENNPTWCGFTNEELIEKGKQLCETLGRRFSCQEWRSFAKKHNLPQNFSNYRKTVLGTIKDFSIKCSNLSDTNKYNQHDPRTVKSFQNLVRNGFDAYIDDNGNVVVNKICEVCRKKFTVDKNQRERMLCSNSCYRKQKRQLQQSPKNTIPSELNHKVVSIEFDGYENVYNGTVEEFHNFFIGGFEETTKKGNHKFCYINNLQCGEVIIRGTSPQGGGGLCNLTEVVARENDTFEDLKNKIEIATILGTIQSSITNFRYVRKGWKFNAEDERLLGVSITGGMDCKLLNKHDEATKDVLNKLREYSICINKEWAKRLNINESKAIGVTKPSGSVSQLVNSSSGLHARFSKYYLRSVRNDSKDPLCKFLIENGFYHEKDVMNNTNEVFFFPIKSPDNCIFANEETAIEQLEKYLLFKNEWCQHNPSITVYVREEEWLEVGAWVYKHFEDIIGVTFLPYSDHIYKQAPYTEITKEEYEEWIKKTPKEIDWNELANFEKEDYTTSSQELSCFGGQCDLSF